LSGHWRQDHLFSLQQALNMYDAVQERIAAYEKEILRKLGDMEREEQRGIFLAFRQGEVFFT